MGIVKLSLTFKGKTSIKQAEKAPAIPCIFEIPGISNAISTADVKNAKLPSKVLLKSFILPIFFPTRAAAASEMIRNSMLVITIILSKKIVIIVKEISKYVELTKDFDSCFLKKSPTNLWIKSLYDSIKYLKVSLIKKTAVAISKPVSTVFFSNIRYQKGMIRGVR